MRIGPYELRNPWILAPMAGVSEMPFRRIALELGAAWAPTELVSCEGLMWATTRTLKYLRHDPAIENPFCVQIFGGDPGKMAQAALIAKAQGAHVIDVNMGCPVPKVTKNGAGSALMCDPPRAGEIIRAIRDATGLPVSAKIRAGWDSKSLNAVDVALQLEAGGACAIAIHPRTRAQGYSGRADWTVIKRVKEAVKVPVVGNGDVKSRADADRMFAETGCDAVMVGRAALGNPWIFRELTGGPPPTVEERQALVLRHFDEHLQFAGDALGGVRGFRRMLLWYAHGLRGAATFRQQACVIDDPDEVRAAIRKFFAEATPDAHAEGEADVDLRQAFG
ncbi:MAG: tRNA dihydrouridine synthase DusB [Myxococcales bacterium]